MNFDKEYFKHTKEIIISLDSEGNFIDATQSFAEAIGWSLEEIKSKNYATFLHPDDLQKSIDAFGLWINTGSKARYFENRYIHKNGSHIWFQWDGFLLEDKSKAYAIARDITPLKEKEFFFEAIQETAKIGSWKLNVETYQVQWSSETYRIHELPVGTLIDLSKALDHYPGYAKEVVSNKVKNLIEKNEFYDVEVPFLTAKGRQRWVRAIGCSNDNKPSKEVYGVFQDITEQFEKRKELDLQRSKTIQSAKMASLGEMAANIAHEINNPLSIIQGRAEHLRLKLEKKELSNEELIASLEKIEKTSERIAKMIKGLSAISKSDSEQDFKKVKLSDVISDSLDLFSEKLKNNGYSLEVSSVPDVQIECLGNQINQVFLNLVNNSIEALREKNEKWIRINFRMNKSNLVIEFIDSGKGIEKSILDKIMLPFFTTKGTHGTGLGLSITNNIIVSHKGKFYYDNTKANTTFCIELPIT